MESFLMMELTIELVWPSILQEDAIGVEMECISKAFFGRLYIHFLSSITEMNSLNR
jgi:hypothetical protein